MQNITSVAKEMQVKLVKGTRGEVKVFISRKSCCTQFYHLLEYQLNDGKIRNFLMENLWVVI